MHGNLVGAMMLENRAQNQHAKAEHAAVDAAIAHTMHGHHGHHYRGPELVVVNPVPVYQVSHCFPVCISPTQPF